MNRIVRHAIILSLALAGTAQAQVPLAISGPLTGPNAVFGLQFKTGVEQAVEDVNAMGGILGQKVVVSTYDDQSDPQLGVDIAKKIAESGAKLVIGHFNSSVTEPASEIYYANEILMITPSSTTTRITERGMWNVFRTCGRDDQQGKVAGAYIVQNFKGKKVAMAHDGTNYGIGFADETKKIMNSRGMTEVLFEGVRLGQTDFSDLISRIKASGADLVFWGGLHTEGGLLVKQMREHGVNAVMMSGDGITSDEFARIGGAATEGTLMTFSQDPRARPEAKAVVEKFRAKRFEPEAYTLYSYAGVQVIKQAAEAAKTLDAKKIAAQILTGMRFKTVIGELSYDKKGDITRFDFVMYMWKKTPSGRITYVEIR